METENKISICREFGNFLYNKRLAMGMTQQEFAIYLYDDIKRQDLISKIESRKRKITIKTMEHILNKLKSGLVFVE